jgi:hypothetical protein
MQTREQILKEAIGTGEVIKVRYYGGSRPGEERELVIKKILPKGYVRCFCLRDNMEKTFFINKIEIDGMSAGDSVNKESSDFLSNYQSTDPANLELEPLEMPKAFSDFIKKNSQTWANSGWYVNTEINSLSLHQKKKDGKPMKRPIILLQYENMRYYTTDNSGKKPIALFRKNEKPYMVQTVGEATVSFADFDKAAKRFLTLLSLKEDKPTRITAPEIKETKEPEPAEIKSTTPPTEPAEIKSGKNLNLAQKILAILFLTFAIPWIIFSPIGIINVLIKGEIGAFIFGIILEALLIIPSWKIIKKLRKK